MTPEEIKSLLKDVISNFIKTDPDAAKENLHTALTAKARERINPTPTETEEEATARIEATEATENS